MGLHFLTGGPRSVNIYDDALRANGKDPHDFHVAAMRPTFVASTRERAWENAAKPLHYMAAAYLQWTTEAGSASGATQRATPLPSVQEIIRKQTFDFFGEPVLVGTPDDVITQIEESRTRSRLTDLVCGMALPGMPPDQIRSGMALFAREVIPHFRRPNCD
jgi:alkanesulfonate monooxygenase SsuD/methylene tetrahydromethanopterin reductase-like flavin-dependent oxidoreductase (luciferase family)